MHETTAIPQEPLGFDAEGPLSQLAADLRGRAEAIQASGGFPEGERSLAEVKALGDWWKGRWLPPSVHQLISRPSDTKGAEHEVWYDRDRGRVVKATWPWSFGARADGAKALPSEYFDRLQAQNTLWGDDIVFEGIWEPHGQLRAVTSQPLVLGRPARPEEIDFYLTTCGFAKIGLEDACCAWLRADERVLISGAHGGNMVITPGGALVALNVPVMVLP